MAGAGRDNSSVIRSAPFGSRSGAGDDAAVEVTVIRRETSARELACAELAGAYLRLGEAIQASAARGDAAEENRLRNRAQVVLGRLSALRRPTPDVAELAW